MRRFLHMTARIAVLAVIAVVLGVVGKEACPRNSRPETDTNFDNLKPLAAGIGTADKVVLYEGLPHQFNEPELLKHELQTKKTVQHHGFPFYTESLPLKDGDARELTKLFTEGNSFQPWRGEKKCGGFHPDYCLEWHAGGEVYRGLICFGCHEAKFYGPSVELYCDINQDAFDKLKAILLPYRQQRPSKPGDE